MFQRVLKDLQQLNGPPLQAKAITHLRNRGYIIKMASAEAAAWVRDPIRKLDRTYNLLVPFSHHNED